MDGASGDGAHKDISAMPAARGQDKGKRDEWSENGVLCLLEFYESKWLLRNRAKLKGSDWENIAEKVSTSISGSKTLKTANQCKNKIESMKKRYRAETAASHDSGSSSSWQFYARMDDMLKGTANSLARPKSNHIIDPQALPKADVEVEVEIEQEQVIHDSVQDDESNSLPVNVNSIANANVDVDETNCKKEKGKMDSDPSTPRSKEAVREDGKSSSPFKRRKLNGDDLAESVTLFARTMLNIEQARLDMYKESERIRAEAEIKRGELELKKTEIIANTQLEMAKLFARQTKVRINKCPSSSLKTEISMRPRRDREGD